MSLDQLRNCNLGRSCANATGSSGVGYTLYDVSGSVIVSRTTTGVYQLTPNSGLYAAYISFPNSFRGQIVWDTGSIFPTASYAIEQYNVEENNPKIDETLSLVQQMSGTVAQLYDIQYGRWKIVGNQMLFYKEDNATLIATYNLFDDLGAGTMDSVFERRKA